ncbi:ABC transporter permease [Microbacterium barkeri]|uniref:ABC transporter permease n=1 Tax=Microbacterium barkeri TaxID=33917 RepID=A0A9W6LVZ7_9MICO|nr:ABC transporter permease [Microbacterium barkeri]MDR6877695.1 ABC-2 type transport system permease protein [Microbacterium barkeri]GLJ60851.1 ABC transporter permease [Microbacterium barkeri]
MSTPTSVRSTHRTPAPAPTTAQSVWLVAERELAAKLRSKAFLISTAILVLGALAAVLWMGFSAAGGGTTPVAATQAVAAQLRAADGLEVIEVDDRAEAEQLVTAGEVDAAAVQDDASPTGVTVIAQSEAPASVIAALSLSPTVELLDAGAGEESPLRYILGIVFGMVFFMAAMSFGTPITQSVIEEKQTRVVEILISAIPARVLLAGKVLGNTILALAQIVVLIAVAVVGLIVTGQTEFLQGLGAPMVWFAVFFLFGFILLAAMFAAAGSLVSRQEDSGPTLTPLIYLTMIPYFLVIFLGDNPLVMTILSYVPFSAAVGMPLRLFFNEAQWWEPLLSLVVLLGSCVLVIALGAKIYENSLLRMGARVKLKDALKG